jgi:long-chain acyl-CoA synthetase
MAMLHDLLLTNVSDRPEATAIMTLDRAWTYAEIMQVSARYRTALQQAGITKGDRVALLLANGVDAVAAYFGILLADGVVVPLDVRNPVALLARQLTDCGAKLAISATQHATLVMELQRRHAEMQWLVELAESYSPPKQTLTPEVNCEHRDPERPAVIFYTSGSSATPKGVILSHRAILANTRDIVRSLNLSSQDRVMQVLPLAYCYGASLLHTHFAVGGSVVFDHRYAYPVKVLAHMRTSHCTGFAGVPTTLHSLARCCPTVREAVPSLRYLSCAGGALDLGLAETLRRSLHPGELFVMYGLTEASARLTCLDPRRWDDKRGSVGQALAGISLRIVRADGTSAANGEPGEIWARGESIMSGYWHDVDATARTLVDGWLHTGDLGYLDADGFLYVTGRQSDFIKTRGYRLNPRDITAVLLSHPEVTQALTLGRPDAVLGERIAVLVCLRAGSLVDERDLRGHCRTRLPLHMCPTDLKIVATLPLSVNGKPDRILAERLLRED